MSDQTGNAKSNPAAKMKSVVSPSGEAAATSKASEAKDRLKAAKDEALSQVDPEEAAAIKAELDKQAPSLSPEEDALVESVLGASEEEAAMTSVGVEGLIICKINAYMPDHKNAGLQRVMGSRPLMRGMIVSNKEVGKLAEKLGSKVVVCPEFVEEMVEEEGKGAIPKKMVPQKGGPRQRLPVVEVLRVK